MGGIVRCLLQRGDDDLLDLVQQDRRRPARPGLVDQPVQPPLDEPAPPLRHRLLADPQRSRPPECSTPPSAHASTILDRNANACVDFARRAHRCSCPAPHRQRQAGLRPARPGPIDQPGQPRLGEPAADVMDRHHAHPELVGQPGVHHIPAPSRPSTILARTASRDPPPAANSGQLSPLRTGQHELARLHHSNHKTSYLLTALNSDATHLDNH